MAMNRFLLITLGILVMDLGFYFDPGHARSLNLIKMIIPGDSRDCKGFHYSKDIESLGKFAVQEHNKKQNALLEFVRVLKAKEQVVAGKLYYLTLEAIDVGHKKTFEAKVWVKPWMSFKQLQEFKNAGGGLSFPP